MAILSFSFFVWGIVYIFLVIIIKKTAIYKLEKIKILNNKR